MFTNKTNLEDLTSEDLDNYIVETTADKSNLEACSNKLFNLVKGFIDSKESEKRLVKKETVLIIPATKI